MIVKAVVVEVILIKAGEGAEEILENLFGFDLVKEGESSLILFFGQVIFERLLTVFFEDEGVRLIHEDEEIWSVLNEFDVLLELFVEFSGNVQLVSLFIVVVVGLG